MNAAAELHDVNWCAFGLTVLNKKFTVERALDYMCGDEYDKRDLTDDDMADIMKLRNENVSYKELGEMYGMTESGIWRRVKQYERKLLTSPMAQTSPVYCMRV